MRINRAVSLGCGAIAGMVWVAVLSLLIPSGDAGVAGDLLLDRNTPHPPCPRAVGVGVAKQQPDGLHPRVVIRPLELLELQDQPAERQGPRRVPELRKREHSQPELHDRQYRKPVTLPEASDGDGTLSYTLSPDVPGLTFDPATRTLSGTPTTPDTYSMT